MPALAVGTVLQNRYRISRVLYQSQLTNVYAAEDIHLKGNIWAIKEMKFLAMDNLERMLAIEQFEIEVKKLAALNHKNLAKVIDFFVEGQNLYIIREFIAAYDIATIMSKSGSPISESEVLSWGIQLSDVFGYLYSQKFPAVFFRELNLTNILIDSKGSLKLIDLGLARIFQTETHPGRLENIGSLEYSPPELFEEGGEFKETALVYSLGAILFHIATGRNPSQNLFNLPPVESINPELSALTCQIIKKATRNEKEKRYQSLSDMKKELQIARKRLLESLEKPGPKGLQKKVSPPAQSLLLLLVIIILSGCIVYLIYKLFFH